MENKPEETLSDIHRLMERSSRFHSLSGLSLIAAGACGLLGLWWIKMLLRQSGLSGSHEHAAGPDLIRYLILAAACTLVAALISAFFFTWIKARKRKLALWDALFRRVSVSFAIPMIAGGLFILGMLFYQQYQFISTACLLFYGLALVNASHYMMKEIRYLGLFEILFGLISLINGYEFLTLLFGFGIMNILYGLTIWYKQRDDLAK